MKIVLASINQAKYKEINAILSESGIELIPQYKFNISETEETGKTFVENAILKARAASEITKLPAIADDSGLVIEALGGAPGLYSSRFAGPGSSDKDNINKVLELLALSGNNKPVIRAYFYCVIVLLVHANHPNPIICTGRLSGEIIQTPKGENGFGYDPIFYLTEYGKTIAELPPELKNQISHRAEALQQLKAQIAILDLW